MDFWKMVVALVQKKKWELLVIIALIVLIGMLGNLLYKSVPSIIKQTTTEVIEEQLTPIKSSMSEMSASLISLNADFQEFQLDTLYDDGVSAYKKFTGLTGQELIDKLSESTQNANAAQKALRNPDIREKLRKIDPSLTAELIVYWQIDVS